MEQTGDFPKKRTQIHTQGPPSSCREITAISHYMSSTSWSRPEATVAIIIKVYGTFCKVIYFMFMDNSFLGRTVSFCVYKDGFFSHCKI